MPNRRRLWIAVQLVIAAAFLGAVRQYYEPGAGFTAFIEFPGSSHDYELPAVQRVPHYHHPQSGGYDGQFYAQLALEPLLRDGAIDRAMDNPPYRARRILLSWTAYALGGGDPARILQVYALQNVAAWLLLGWLLWRWIPPTSGRHTALWAGCLLSHGMLSSVRYALPDGPAVVLIAAAVAVAGAAAVQTGSENAGPARMLGAALVVGLAGLARETGTLAAAMFARDLRRSPRTWLLAGSCLLLCLLPLALWIDYLRSIYRSFSTAGTDHLTTFLSGISWKVDRIRVEAEATGMTFQVWTSVLAGAGFAVQGAIVIGELMRSRGRSAWALIGTPFLLLALFTHADVFAGTPGAFTRVFLPVAIAANAILASRTHPGWWAAIVLANLGVYPAVMLLWFRWG